uniref:RGS domain-containing protein n=2 Tax=Eptatretus burgeri TaxID=7764 RepID=A0A8C4N534_EPTBU
MSQVTAKEKKQWRKSALSAAASDGELAAKQLPGGLTEQGLSNSSLPNLDNSHDEAYEGRIASWAISFERLLLDPLGVQFFTIFNLMKFDSYTRFLKSEVYQDCLRAEVEGHSLPCGTLKQGSPAVCIASPERANNRKTIRKNKEGSEEEDGQSVLGNIMLWPQIWGSIGRTQKRTEEMGSQTVQPAVRGDATIKQGGPVPTSTQSPSVMQALSTEKDLNSEQSGTGHFCRVQLPDSSSTVISVRAGLSVRDALLCLTEKRGLKLIALDAFLLKGMKALDFEADSEMLANQEIRLEKRVLFRYARISNIIFVLSLYTRIKHGYHGIIMVLLSV